MTGYYKKVSGYQPSNPSFPNPVSTVQHDKAIGPSRPKSAGMRVAERVENYVENVFAPRHRASGKSTHRKRSTRRNSRDRDNDYSERSRFVDMTYIPPSLKRLF